MLKLLNLFIAIFYLVVIINAQPDKYIAVTFDDLPEAIKTEGYKFISIDEALEDEAYKAENKFVGKYGPSWIHRWALTKGVDKSFFNGEPKVPQYLKDYSGIQYE